MLEYILAIGSGVAVKAIVGLFDAPKSSDSGKSTEPSKKNSPNDGEMKTTTLTRLPRKVRVVELLNFNGLEALGTKFHTEYVLMCERVGIPPNSLAAVIASESKFNPAAQNWQTNKKTGKKYLAAAGLVQFYFTTAKSLGTSVEAISKMSALEQLPFVEKLWANTVKTFPRRKWTLCETYMTNFVPKYSGKPPEFVIASKDDPDPYRASIYHDNDGFDRAKKGYILVRDVCNAVEQQYAAAKRKTPIVVTVPLDAKQDGIT